MVTTSQRPVDSASKAQTGILVIGILLLFLLMFGPQRQRIAQQFVSTTAGSSVETELIEIANQHSPSVEVIAQMQYTQQALFKTELLTDKGDIIRDISQDFNSRSDESSKRVAIPDWPNTDAIKVKLTVASQSITAAPPEGVTSDQVPVIFEVNVYRQWLNRAYLWPAFFSSIGLWFIVKLARKKANSW